MSEIRSTWIRWRHTFAEGPGDWTWEEISSQKTLESWLDAMKWNLQREYDWSDHYRGVEAEIAEVPEDVLLHKIHETARTADFLAIRLADLHVQLQERQSRIEKKP
jgi:hypothetical protein